MELVGSLVQPNQVMASDTAGQDECGIAEKVSAVATIAQRVASAAGMERVAGLGGRLVHVGLDCIDTLVDLGTSHSPSAVKLTARGAGRLRLG